jgi:hypothetical protein
MPALRPQGCTSEALLSLPELRLCRNKARARRSTSFDQRAGFRRPALITVPATPKEVSRITGLTEAWLTGKERKVNA